VHAGSAFDVPSGLGAFCKLGALGLVQPPAYQAGGGVREGALSRCSAERMFGQRERDGAWRLQGRNHDPQPITKNSLWVS